MGHVDGAQLQSAHRLRLVDESPLDAAEGAGLRIDSGLQPVHEALRDGHEVVLPSREVPFHIADATPLEARHGTGCAVDESQVGAGHVRVEAVEQTEPQALDRGGVLEDLNRIEQRELDLLLVGGLRGDTKAEDGQGDHDDRAHRTLLGKGRPC